MRVGYARSPEQRGATPTQEVFFDKFVPNPCEGAEGLWRHYEHITLNEDRVPGIAGTTMKVVELVVEQQAYGWSPEELDFQHPYPTLGQIHSALAYY